LTVLVGAKRSLSLSSSLRRVAKLIALWIVASLVEDATVGDAAGMVVVSKL
jgi:hypothetical protein